MFVLLGKATIYMAITAGYEMTFEMFPTAIRAQGGAWASSLANIAALLAPYVPYSVSDQVTIIEACVQHYLLLIHYRAQCSLEYPFTSYVDAL